MMVSVRTRFWAPGSLAASSVRRSATRMRRESMRAAFKPGPGPGRKAFVFGWTYWRDSSTENSPLRMRPLKPSAKVAAASSP